jgi:hypothetical protein
MKTSVHVVAVTAATTILVGWIISPYKLIDPHNGLGYILGWTGASLMALMFSYSMHKRFEWMWKIGKTAEWFNIHQLLGIFGPITILYHSNYHLGSPNSNIALFSMLIVAASGIIGRYLRNRKGFERLFSAWHVGHLPIVFIMIICVFVHVIAVHVY